MFTHLPWERINVACNLKIKKKASWDIFLNTVPSCGLDFTLDIVSPHGHRLLLFQLPLRAKEGCNGAAFGTAASGTPLGERRGDYVVMQLLYA